ncbi:MAG: ATP-binding protein [Myxococcota bacterium]
MKPTTYRLGLTTTVVFAALLAASVLVVWFTDEAMTSQETHQLALAFDGISERLLDSAAPEDLLPARNDDEEVARVGRTRVHTVEDYYLVTIDAGRGQEIEAGRFVWDWAPGSTLQITLALSLTIALGSAVLLTLPLVRRVRKLAGHVGEFAAGRYDARARLGGHDEVAELAGHFNRMADRVQANFEAQRALVQAIAHEYRTPLAAARVASALVLEAVDEDDRRLQVQRLEHALDDLQRLADEVRYYARAGEAPQHETIDLAELVRSRVARLETPAGTEVRIEAPEQLPFAGDLPLLARVIDNLVDNALRYASSTVRVKLQANDEGVELRVDDDGPGVPEADRERIFEPFVRLDESRQRAEGGHGLGLSIVSRMVDAAEGSVVATTSDLGGLSVVVTMKTP